MRQYRALHDLFGQGNLLHSARRGRAQTGRAAVFLRFAGCNLWSGLERDRAQAVCQFCDTDFVGTDGPAAENFPTRTHWREPCSAQWPQVAAGKPYVVCTGGEPCCNSTPRLIAALMAHGFEIGIETNGTLLPPPGIDWICVSPKADAEQKLTQGDELKLVYPQDEGAAGAVRGPGFPPFLPAADGQ